MSLHRVTSMESWERPQGSREVSPTRQHRRMSFNPVSDWAQGDSQPVMTAPLVAQVKVMQTSRGKRVAQVAVACLYCLLSGGVVFGFAALKPVLVAEGVYRGLCTPEDPGSQEKTCYEQEIRLNLMFTIAAVATNVCALPVGTILDRYGPRVSGIIGSVMLAIGSIFLTCAPRAAFDCYIPGYFFLALGGPFVFISSFQLSNCFPLNSGFILALLTGAFDTSSAVFLIYRLIYEGSNGAFKPWNFFTFYLIVPVFVLIMQLVLMPKENYRTVGELTMEVEGSNFDPDTQNHSPAEAGNGDAHQYESIRSEIEPLLGKDGSKHTRIQDQKHQASGVWGALHGKSALQQICTVWFVLITLFTVMQMLRINYFVATIRTQYTEILQDTDKAARINHFFDIALPVGGVVAVPFIGLLLDNLSTAMVLAVLTVLATAIGILGILPFMWAAYLGIILFVIFRPLYYTAVSDYAAKVFGFHTFGKVYGLIICIAGLFGFAQSALDALTHQVFNNDPVPVNIILFIAVAVIGLILALFVWRQSQYTHMVERADLEEEAEESESQERLMPGATDRPNTDVPAGYGTST